MAVNNETDLMWDAMKGVHYKRTIRNLEKGIKNCTDLKSALAMALDTVVNAVKAEAGTFWFYDRATDGRIYPFAVYGGGDLGDFSLALGEGIAGGVIERGKEQIIEDCASDVRWQGKADAKTGFVTKSMIVVPLSTSEYTFGCIQIINKRNGDFYDAQDLIFVKALASFAADMFDRLGFVKNNTSSNAIEEVTFSQLFATKDALEMEILLRSIKEFADLGIKDQQLVLTNMQEIHAVMSRNKRRGR